MDSSNQRLLGAGTTSSSNLGGGGSVYRLDPDAQIDDSHFAFAFGDHRRPWKKVAFCLFLLLFGVVLLSVGIGMFASGMNNGKFETNEFFHESIIILRSHVAWHGSLQAFP